MNSNMSEEMPEGTEQLVGVGESTGASFDDSGDPMPKDGQVD